MRGASSVPPARAGSMLHRSGQNRHDAPSSRLESPGPDSAPAGPAPADEPDVTAEATGTGDGLPEPAKTRCVCHRVRKKVPGGTPSGWPVAGFRDSVAHGVRKCVPRAPHRAHGRFARGRNPGRCWRALGLGLVALGWQLGYRAWVPADYGKIREENIARYGWDTAVLDLLGQLYSERTHFIFELIQNAEDAGATELAFELSGDRLELRHDGRPFTEADVRGVCGVGTSAKSGDLTAIGKFGIGFKP